jgi:hypothetical protein
MLQKAQRSNSPFTSEAILTEHCLVSQADQSRRVLLLELLWQLRSIPASTQRLDEQNARLQAAARDVNVVALIL